MKAVDSVVILGGGSAGWLTAGRLAAAFPNLSITLIESPNQPIIGVGEGTWPSMRETLRKIGIDELSFIQQCDASFKQGSRFNGWRTTDEDEGYCHPFTTPLGYQEINIHDAWQRMRQSSVNRTLSFDEAVSPQAVLMKQNRAPKQLSTPPYAGVLNYGYHLDASKFATMLSQHCIGKLKVKHISDDVTQVINNDVNKDDIGALRTSSSGIIKADFFIDCSGTNAKLIGEHYKVGSVNVSKHLINNRAVAARVPYQENDEVAASTIATAKPNGWIWDIGLSSRRGLGMVYSSEYNTSEQASLTLLDYIQRSNPSANSQNIQIRELAFTPAYRKAFWKNNCLAIGMSAGFVEPLEASALAMVELSINMLVDEFPRNREHMNIVANRFNDRFSYRWQRAIDFIHLHYLCSQRSDSEYWIRMRNIEHASERLQSLISLWPYQAPSRHDLPQNEEIFPSASYQFVLYGMGFDTAANPLIDNAMMQSHTLQLQQQNQQKLAQMQKGLPSTKALLKHILKQTNNVNHKAVSHV